MKCRIEEVSDRVHNADEGATGKWSKNTFGFFYNEYSTLF